MQRVQLLAATKARRQFANRELDVQIKKPPRPSGTRGEAERQRRLGGRPSLFQSGYRELVYKFALMGASDAELAYLLEISTNTFMVWCKSKPGFLDAVRSGREVANANVVRALYKRATGYNHPAVKIFYNKDTGEVVKVPFTQHYPPETRAIEYWLFNRASDHWQRPNTVAAAPAADGDSSQANTAPTIVIAPVAVQAPPRYTQGATTLEVESEPGTELVTTG
jgi:hypothetical protein